MQKISLFLFFLVLILSIMINCSGDEKITNPDNNNPVSGFLSNFPTMYIRGTLNSWDKTSMTLISNNTWM